MKTTEEIHRRAMVLAQLAEVGMFASEGEYYVSTDWLEQHDLTDAVAPSEEAVLYGDAWTQEGINQATWACEPLAMLNWALGLSSLPQWDEDVTPLSQIYGMKEAEPSSFALRSEAEVYDTLRVQYWTHRRIQTLLATPATLDLRGWIERAPDGPALPPHLTFTEDGDLRRSYDGVSIVQEGFDGLPYGRQFIDLTRSRLKALKWLWHDDLAWDETSTCPHSLDALRSCVLPYAEISDSADGEVPGDPNLLDRWGGLPLSRAVVHQDTEAAARLLTQGADPNAVDLDGNTALLYACAAADLERIDLLLAHGADLHVANLKHETPLVLAACAQIPTAEKRALLERLIAHGADLNAPTPDGLSPLIHALRNHQPETATLLCALGADVNGLYRDWSAIFYAVETQEIELVQGIIDAGADLTQEDDIQRTPLLYAFGLGFLEAVERLVEAGADVHAKDPRAQSTLHWAACLGELAWCKRLRQEGVTLDDQSVSGHTALTLAINNDYPSCALFLAQEGADPLLPCEPHHKTALHLLAERGWVEVFTTLLQGQDLPLDVRDREGAQPLAYAAAEGQVPMIALLLAHGADPHATFGPLLTTLHMAAMGGHTDAVDALIVFGVDPHALTLDTKDSPLHMAVYSGSADCVQRLLEAGADASQANAGGQTPKQLAQNNPTLRALFDDPAT